MRHSPLSEAVARVLADNMVHKPPERDKAMQARILTDLLPVVTAKCPFVAGDVVEQCPAYDRYAIPDGRLAIVTQVLDAPRDQSVDGTDDRPDIRILVEMKTPDGSSTWTQFLVESWRFQKYTGEIA